MSMDSESARFRFLISHVGAVKRIVIVALLLLVALGGWVIWQSFSEPRRIVSQVIAYFRGPTLPPGFASGNGRLEATEYDIATKRPTRIITVLVKEGNLVEPGQVVVRMDTADLGADLRTNEAQLTQAREDKRRALAAVVQRASDLQSAVAAISQRESDLRRADAAMPSARARSRGRPRPSPSARAMCAVPTPPSCSARASWSWPGRTSSARSRSSRPARSTSRSSTSM